MKILKITAAAALLLATSTVSYWLGWSSHVETKLVIERCEVDHSKDYVVACLLSDICRCALDDPYLDAPGFEDLFWDWMINQDVVDPEAFKDYVYSY